MHFFQAFPKVLFYGLIFHHLFFSLSLYIVVISRFITILFLFLFLLYLLVLLHLPLLLFLFPPSPPSPGVLRRCLYVSRRQRRTGLPLPKDISTRIMIWNSWMIFFLYFIGKRKVPVVTFVCVCFFMGSCRSVCCLVLVLWCLFVWWCMGLVSLLFCCLLFGRCWYRPVLPRHGVVKINVYLKVALTHLHFHVTFTFLCSAWESLHYAITLVTFYSKPQYE